MTNGWMDHRAEAQAWNGEGEGGGERNPGVKRAGYSGQIIVKGRENTFCLRATLFLIKGVL